MGPTMGFKTLCSVAHITISNSCYVLAASIELIVLTAAISENKKKCVATVKKIPPVLEQELEIWQGGSLCGFLSSCGNTCEFG